MDTHVDFSKIDELRIQRNLFTGVNKHVTLQDKAYIWALHSYSAKVCIGGSKNLTFFLGGRLSLVLLSFSHFLLLRFFLIFFYSYYSSMVKNCWRGFHWMHIPMLDPPLHVYSDFFYLIKKRNRSVYVYESRLLALQV